MSTYHIISFLSILIGDLVSEAQRRIYTMVIWEDDEVL